jgi:predicted lipoprotein with Yx(FWY)xxD motif
VKMSRIGVAIAVTLLLVGGGSALAANAPAPRQATVTTASSRLGRILVDGKGRTLYLFEKDKHGASACAGLCVTYWPPLLTHGGVTASGGAKRSLVGSSRRADGSRQVTYAGHPLYLFSGDLKRGQTNGEGLRDFGAPWYALAATGKKIGRD